MLVHTENVIQFNNLFHRISSLNSFIHLNSCEMMRYNLCISVLTDYSYYNNIFIFSTAIIGTIGVEDNHQSCALATD